jgi:hypothetical protein
MVFLVAAIRPRRRGIRRPSGRRKLSRKALAALGAAALQHFAAADRFHARPKTVPPLADELAGLICALHDAISELPNV